MWICSNAWIWNAGFVSHTHFIKFSCKPGPLLCTYVYVQICIHCCDMDPRQRINCWYRSLVTVWPCSMPTLCVGILLGETHMSATLAYTKLLPPTVHRAHSAPNYQVLITNMQCIYLHIYNEFLWFIWETCKHRNACWQGAKQLAIFWTIGQSKLTLVGHIFCAFLLRHIWNES